MIKPSLLPTPYQLYASYWTSQPLDWTNPNVFKQSKPSLTWFEHFFAKKLTHCFLTKVPSEHTTAKFLDFTFQFLSPPWFFTTKFLDFTFSLFGKDSLGTFFVVKKKFAQGIIFLSWGIHWTYHWLHFYIEIIPTEAGSQIESTFF